MRKTIAIIIGKIISIIGKKMHKGSSKPGEIALKIDPHILEKIKFPEIRVMITGTTGKTSIAGTVASLLTECGLSVAQNVKGANLTRGIVTVLVEHANLSGKIKKDAIVLEVDERYVKEIVKYLKPNYFIINNLSRDQLSRNGHFDIVWEDIHACIKPEMHLILNSDDPLVNYLGHDHQGEITYYGMAELPSSTKKPLLDTLDMAYCPICHKKLKFDYFHYGNLGSYSCPREDFGRVKPQYEITSVDLVSRTMTINQETIIPLQTDILYNAYNNVASYTLLKLLDIKEEKIIEAFKKLSVKVKRLERFSIAGRETLVLTSKNETPISYNQTISYIAQEKELKTIIVGFENVSGRYNYRDLSWLWDIHFEGLADQNIDKIVCVGPFASDLAMRLYYAGIKKEKIIVNHSIDTMIETVKAKTKGKIYAMVYFDLAYKFKDFVRGDKI